jgi:hypothetical protein
VVTGPRVRLRCVLSRSRQFNQFDSITLRGGSPRGLITIPHFLHGHAFCIASTARTRPAPPPQHRVGCMLATAGRRCLSPARRVYGPHSQGRAPTRRQNGGHHAECVGSGGVREVEASAATAADWDVKFTIKRVHPRYFASRERLRYPLSTPLRSRLSAGWSLRFPKVVGRDQFGILHARHAVTR